MEWLDALLASGVRSTTPILLATLACLPTLWTRDVNIGLEGLMILGAFSGVALGLVTGSALAAVALTLVLAAALGWGFALLVTKLRVDVFVAGLVLFILGGAVAVYLLDALFEAQGNLADPAVPGLPVVELPFLAGVPLIGGLVTGHGVLTWVAVLLLVLVVVMDRRSVLVRHLRAAGSHPAALATSGGAVDRARILAQVWCFVLSALAGLHISLGQLSLFTVGMTGGLGFVALAAAIFSGGRVLFAAAVSLGFGLATALTYQFTADVPFELGQMVPSLTALIALVVISRRSLRAHRRPPAAAPADSAAPARAEGATAARTAPGPRHR